MPSSNETSVQAGDIVQVGDEGPVGYRGCLAEVDKVLSFGVRAFLRVPPEVARRLAEADSDDERRGVPRDPAVKWSEVGGAIYLRLPFGSFSRLWRANQPATPSNVVDLSWETSRVRLSLRCFNVAGDAIGAHHDIGRAFRVVLVRKEAADDVTNAGLLGYEATFLGEHELDLFLRGASATLTLFGETTFPTSFQHLLARYAAAAQSDQD